MMREYEIEITLVDGSREYEFKPTLRAAQAYALARMLVVTWRKVRIIYPEA